MFCCVMCQNPSGRLNRRNPLQTDHIFFIWHGFSEHILCYLVSGPAVNIGVRWIKDLANFVEMFATSEMKKMEKIVSILY